MSPKTRGLRGLTQHARLSVWPEQVSLLDLSLPVHKMGPKNRLEYLGVGCEGGLIK